MRFKKGSRVEVLSNEDVPLGEWRCGEIISGNGRTYSVQFDCSSMTSKAIVERVPRKAIRPYPSLVRSINSWSVNDIVEIYNVGSWKGAVVSSVLGGDYYVVRLLGSCEEFRTHKSNTRVRQSWQDNHWAVIGKRSRNCEVGRWSIPTSSNSCKMTYEVPQVDIGIKQQAQNDCLHVQTDSNFQESHLVSFRSLKRVSSCCSSNVEAYPRKMRAIEKAGERQQFLAVSPRPVLEKVDAVAYPCENMGEKYTHGSFNNRKVGNYDLGGGNPDGVLAHFVVKCSEPNDSDSDACSVGSCSAINNDTNKLSSHILAGLCDDADTLCSDSESLDVGDEEETCPFPPKDDVEARIHRLEMHAYRSTLEAMYASGPLSWELEALLTNLRISLHISNDEHSLELRNLISSGNKCPYYLNV
ncbi:Plant tudor-like RNA-binding protein [Quillaja saponaria]|uniref:Plant tudor-like RNA-binding protein n=1 Tax=Quillaja saponaria TaxID=32244 RepID=A0AAD7LIE2_QUISA|nr:Plant tudor-like RNA-binding protein [Quillaja saponaria]